jgi:hypothetical protein
VIGGVETHMTEPAADDRDVNARRDEVHGGGMAEAVIKNSVGTTLATHWRQPDIDKNSG